MKKILIYALLFCGLSAKSQAIAPDILNKQWQARWITVPGTEAHDYGVYRFRKTISLSSVPGSFIVHVSADNRYKLFVNEKLVSHGPARGEIYHWNYETVDLAPFLTSGENIISAIVWNTGEYGNEAQISFRTAFIIQGNGSAEAIINSDKSWSSSRNEAYTANPPQLIYSYYAAGPGEKVDFNLEEKDWKKNIPLNGWKPAQELYKGLPKGVFFWTDGWMLRPRKIPPMELTPMRLKKLRKAEGIEAPQNFPEQKVSLTVPAGKKIVLLLDQGHLTNGYPYLNFSGGKNAVITMGYAEALYVDEGDKKDWRAQNHKGNRNDIEKKRFSGVKDEIISSGASSQEYSPLWWRTWRYMQIEITTKDEPLILEDVYGVFTGFPFQMKASFDAGNSMLDSILETGWRTARLCATETYMDCPYYEQLQYVGDTRIQALVSLYNAGDDRLMKNAIELLDQSRMAEGITLSRYPTAHARKFRPSPFGGFP